MRFQTVRLLFTSTRMASPAKIPRFTKKPKLKVENLENNQTIEFKNRLQERRENTAKSIVEFEFNKTRVRIMSKSQTVPDYTEGIVYWMSRDSRVQDNWAFLYAQKLALKNEVPLHVCYCLVNKYLESTLRHFHFLIKGLEKVAEECKKLKISFHLLDGSADDVLPEWISDHKIGAVVCDFSPLRIYKEWLEGVVKKLKTDVPLIQVDAHNIVPCWLVSNKQEYTARTFRLKVTPKLKDYLTEFPPVIQHPHISKFEPEPIDWDKAINTRDADKKVEPVEWAKPGYDFATRQLLIFLNQRLKNFAQCRNNPTLRAQSNLSPWFNFGQLSVQRVALCVEEKKNKHTESVNAFLEEVIVRRELTDNYCYYCEHYDSIEGASTWALKTLDDHRKDKRAYVYTLEQLTQAETHDELWNSAQLQLVKEGKMHGFMRMYWAKKILEWTESPEQALKFALYFNDHYALDGNDPNGYVGCMWSICGIHDQGWAERAVFGKIRYMNYEGCKRKFDVKAYVSRSRGKFRK